MKESGENNFSMIRAHFIYELVSEATLSYISLSTYSSELPSSSQELSFWLVSSSRPLTESNIHKVYYAPKLESYIWLQITQMKEKLILTLNHPHFWDILSVDDSLAKITQKYEMIINEYLK